MVRTHYYLIALLVVIVALGVSYAAGGRFAAPILPRPDQKSYLNPVIDSELRKHFIINFQPLRESFLRAAAAYDHETYIYFAYLNNAAWVGVNERDMFVAASLVKIPLAMTIYKAIETDRLKEDAVYTLEQVNLNAEFSETYGLTEGDTVTIERLVEIMLTKSDNTAANALYTILTRVGITDPLNDVYTAMGWEFSDNGTENYGRIHVKVLSNMFLALYNATYISPEHSNRILAYLTASPFDEEIRAGVPASIPVAHKIGIYERENVYSDCGIVYAPHREYLLCVASKGADQDTARRFMREVSEIAYSYVIRN